MRGHREFAFDGIRADFRVLREREREMNRAEFRHRQFLLEHLFAVWIADDGFDLQRLRNRKFPRLFIADDADHAHLFAGAVNAALRENIAVVGLVFDVFLIIDVETIRPNPRAVFGMDDDLIRAGADERENPRLVIRIRRFDAKLLPARRFGEAVGVGFPFPEELLIFVVQFDVRVRDRRRIFQQRHPKEVVHARKLGGHGEIRQINQRFVVAHFAVAFRKAHFQADHAGLFAIVQDFAEIERHHGDLVLQNVRLIGAIHVRLRDFEFVFAHHFRRFQGVFRRPVRFHQHGRVIHVHDFDRKARAEIGF